MVCLLVKTAFYWSICWSNLNYFSLLLSVSPPLNLVHYDRQQVVQAIDDIEKLEYAGILAFIPHEETEEQEEELVSGKGPKKKKTSS